MTVSDDLNCSVTYNRHNDDRNSFIIQASGSVACGFGVCSTDSLKSILTGYKITILVSIIDIRF
jgi:hypothetical protein